MAGNVQYAAFVLVLLALGTGTHAACYASDAISLSWFTLEIVYGGQVFKSWIDGTDCCGWEGVTCNSEGRVANLTVVAPPVSAPAPPPTGYLVATGLAGLTGLTTLTLKNIGLNGAFPPAWSNLQQLTSLDVEGCDAVGGIPAEWCDMPKLESVVLANNRLNGTVPGCFSDSTSTLKVLDLSGNPLSGRVPSRGVPGIISTTTTPVVSSPPLAPAPTPAPTPSFSPAPSRSS